VLIRKKLIQSVNFCFLIFFFLATDGLVEAQTTAPEPVKPKDRVVEWKRSPFLPPQPTPTEVTFNHSDTETFFLELLSRFPALEENGNTKAAYAIYDLNEAVCHWA